MSIRWFGGRAVRPDTAGYPAAARTLIGNVHVAWLCGDWPDSQITTVQGGNRAVAVLGRARCEPHILQQWAAQGVPDSAVSAFAVAYTVVEVTEHATVVLTDPGWAQPLYIAATADGSPLWGSSSLALAALIDADVDQVWLQQHLRPGHDEGPDGEDEQRSAFAGVTPVPPGTRLTVTPSGITSRPLASADAATSGAIAGSAAGLRAALQGAVAGIAEGSASAGGIAADCSGGLDSTSLAMLLAHHRPARGDVLAVTVHPAGITAGGDLDYAREAVDHARAALAGQGRRLEHLLCPLTDRHVPYSRMLELVPATDEPAPSTIAIARFNAELALLAGRGVADLATGDGGDTLLGPQPGYLPDLAALPTLRSQAELVHHSLGWARLRRTALWPQLTRARATARRGGASETDRTRAAMRIIARTARADAQITETYGISLHNPFTDPRVVGAALTVPGPQRAGPGDYKPLLRRAMTGLLPATVTGRRTKGDFTPDQYRGLRTHLDTLTELVDGALAAHGLIDPARYRALLTRAAAGTPGTGFHQLNPVLAAEVWLRTIAQAPKAARWTNPAEDRPRHTPVSPRPQELR